MAINGGRPSTNEVLVDGVSSLLQASIGLLRADRRSDRASSRCRPPTSTRSTAGHSAASSTSSPRTVRTNFTAPLFEFLQNTHLNANTFNNNLTGVAAAVLAHQYVRRRYRRTDQEEQAILHLHLRRHPAGDSRSVCDVRAHRAAEAGQLLADLLCAGRLREPAGADHLRSVLHATGPAAL